MLVTGDSLGARLVRGVFFSLRLLVLLAALAWTLWVSLGAILEWPASEPVAADAVVVLGDCLLYTSPSPRDRTRSRMPSSA